MHSLRIAKSVRRSLRDCEGEMKAPPEVEVGSRIWFYNEPPKQLFRVRCISPDRRYIICTRPFNLRRTVLYCIADFKEKWRAPDDRVFCEGYETQELIEERMRELCSGEIKLSRRHGVNLALLDILPPPRNLHPLSAPVSDSK